MRGVGRAGRRWTEECWTSPRADLQTVPHWAQMKDGRSIEGGPSVLRYPVGEAMRELREQRGEGIKWCGTRDLKLEDLEQSCDVAKASVT